MLKKINCCRICGGVALKKLYGLGELQHAGVFNPEGSAPSQPLELVICNTHNGCGLVQLLHEFDPELMYGENYGYRSGLNASMVKHLQEIAYSTITKLDGSLTSHPVVLDIGSNDGTLLGHFKNLLPNKTRLFGIDPSSQKFSDYYDASIIRSSQFFSADEFKKIASNQKADIVTSIAMFYDLPNPQQIVNDISTILSDNGIWIVEQSYLPSMLGSNSFDTICHEHTEYYTLQQFEWMCSKADLKISDMELNDSNGGSFRLYIQKSNASSMKAHSYEQHKNIERLLHKNWAQQFEQFSARIDIQKNRLIDHLLDLKRRNIPVCCLGASTKGNVLLQHYGLTPELLPAVAEVNSSKFGMKTPGTKIPIISEEAAIRDYSHFLVLPWHFKQSFITNEKFKGKTLIFPLPEFEVKQL